MTLLFPKLEIYQDGADEADVRTGADNELIAGFTTNPTLMAKAGITDYKTAAFNLIKVSKGKPISLEVFADDFDQMEYQARLIASYGENIFVKIPAQNTKGLSTTPLVKKLSLDGIKLNVTAVFTDDQFDDIVSASSGGNKCIISVFAGRIADTGIDPVPVMSSYAKRISDIDNLSLLWASPREVLNVYQAHETGCDIITATPDLIAKLSLYKKDLKEYSRETVQMFYDDAQKQQFML